MDKEDACNTAFISSFCFPDEFPYEFDSFGSSSALSSPVESVLGSIETESSEDDDFLAGLTRRLTQQLVAEPRKKKWVMAGSPKSTLSGIGSWSLSSNGSSNGENSPPTKTFGAKSDPRDLIFAAGGPVLGLKMNGKDNRSCNYQERRSLGPVWNQNPDTAGKDQNNGFSLSKNFGQGVSQLNQYQLKQEQRPAVRARQRLQPHHQHLQQHQIKNKGRSVLPLGLPQSAWPPLQVLHIQQMHQPYEQSNYSSGKRAAFIGGSSAREVSAGTGVFLPRRHIIPSDSKKNSACSKVLVPAKVVQAQNLNLEDMNIQGHAHPRFNSATSYDGDALVAINGPLVNRSRVCAQ